MRGGIDPTRLHPALVWPRRNGRQESPGGRDARPCIPMIWGRHIAGAWLQSRGAGREPRAWGRFMQLSNEGILVILFVGLVAGWLAGKIVRGTGFGIIGDILVGIAGALISSLIFPKLGIHLGTGIVSEIIYSAIGAIILLLVVRLVRTGGRL